MKRKTMILGVVAVLCLLSTAYNVWKLQKEYDKQVAGWKESAKTAFEEALWMEVDKRSEIQFYSYANVKEGVTRLNTKIPDSVTMMTKGGLRKYKIDRYKYDHSLIKETTGRIDLGTVLECWPL